MMWKPSTRSLLECLAWVELIYSAISVGAGIYALAMITKVVNLLDPLKEDKEEKDALALVTLISIKIVYFLILYFILEGVTAIYLLRAIRQKTLKNLRRWMIFGTIFTVLSFTDFVSTLHATNYVEDLNVTLGIAIKVPTLILVWKYTATLERTHGENLINQI